MKRILTVLAVLMAGGVCAQQFMIGVRRVAVATDYTQDSNAVGAWLMTGTGTVNEIDVAGSNDLTISGTISQSTNVPSGYSGFSRRFEVARAYQVDGGGLDLSGEDLALSAGAWVNISAQSAFSINGLIGKDGSSGDRSWRIASNPSTTSTTRFKVDISGDGTNVTSTALVTGAATGAWQHVSFIYDGSLVTLYLDGSAESTVAHGTGVANSTARFNVSGNDLSGGINGFIDEPWVLDRAITTNELAEIISSGIDGAKGGND